MIGTQGTVVVTGLFGMHGGSVVGVVGVVELVGPTTVDGGTAVVVDPDGGAVVVGPKMVLVVVVPAGPPAHPNDCSRPVNMPATPGKLASLLCTERRTWQIGSRTDGGRHPPVWAFVATGWPTTSPAHIATAQSARRRLRWLESVRSPP